MDLVDVNNKMARCRPAIHGPGRTSQRAVSAHYWHSTCIAEAVDIGDNKWPVQTLFCLRLPLV